MIDIAFIPQLKTAIQNVLDSFTLHVTATEEFKDEVIANAGGVLPMFTWEYHTRMDAVRHKVSISSPFLYGGLLYGYGVGAGLIELLSQTQVTNATTIINAYNLSIADIETSLSGISLYEGISLSSLNAESVNIQKTDDVTFVGLRNMGYFFSSGEIVRAIKFDEPYYQTYFEHYYTEYGVEEWKKVARETIDLPYKWWTSLSKVFYVAPYCYVVYRDRTVKYHVDNE